MKTTLVILLLAALACSGCGTETKAAAKTKTRMVVVDKTRVDKWTTSMVLRDTRRR